MTTPRRVAVVLRVVKGGIGIDWGWLNLPQPQFMPFIWAVWGAAGFPRPTEVNHVKNHPTQPGYTDWNKLRVSAEECRRWRVDPAQALAGIADWLESRDAMLEYGLYFTVRYEDEVHAHAGH